MKTEEIFLSLAKPVQHQPAAPPPPLPKVSPAVQRPPPPVHHTTTINNNHQGVVHNNENIRLQQEVRFDWMVFFLKRIFICIILIRLMIYKILFNNMDLK